MRFLPTFVSLLPTRMALLNDTVTVAILLIMVFGSTTFYLYTRLVQNEKRVALLENLLLSLKMSTEASFMGADMFRSGPDSVQPVSSPSPLKEDDVDVIDEEKYAEMLKEIPSDGLAPATATVGSANVGKSVDVNYEAMTLKELQATGRQNGVAVHGLKKKLGGEELEGADLSVHGFTVNLEEVPKKEE